MTEIERYVEVDGRDKGPVFKKNGRWYWQRSLVQMEPFLRSQTLADVAEWARRCCNGREASVRRRD